MKKEYRLRLITVLSLLVIMVAVFFSACGTDSSATFPTYNAGNHTTQTTPTVTTERDDGMETVYLPLTMTASALNGSGEFETMAQVSYAYDANGNRIKSTSVSNGQQIPMSYTYDQHNNLTSVTGNGTQLAELEYTYDYNGNVLTVQIGQAEEDDTRIEYTYDADGNLLTEAAYLETGELARSLTFCYDDSGNLIQKTDMYKESAISFDYQYDDNNRVIAIFRGEHKIHEFVYNKNGKCTKRVDYSNTGIYTSLNGIYNSDGMLERLEYCSPDGECRYKINWEYVALILPKERAQELTKETNYFDIDESLFEEMCGYYGLY